MHSVKRIAAACLTAVVFFSMSGCAENEKKVSFSEFCDDEFRETIESDSMLAHSIVSDPSEYGVTFNDDDYNLGDVSLDELKNCENEVKKELKRLYQYNRNSLSEEEQITYDCLESYFLTQKELAKGYMLQNAFALHSGLAANLTTNFIEYTFIDKDDVDHYLMYIKDIPRYVGQVCDFTREQSKQGYFMPDRVADLVYEQCVQYLESDDDPLIDSFNTRIKSLGLSETEEDEYIKKNEEYVEEYFRPSYQMMADLMKELKGTAVNQGGLAGFGDEAKKYYEAIVKDKTSSDYSVDEIKDILDDTASDILKQASAILIVDPDCYEEAMNFQPDADTPEKVLKFLTDNIGKDFPDPVTLNYSIEYQSKACEVDGTIAYYVPCRIDDVNVNNMKVNGSAVEGNGMMLYTVLAHEGYPGHLYEWTWFYDNDDVPDVRKILDFIGASEGWAEYVSKLTLGYLDMSENAAKMYELNDMLTYVVVSRLDIGVNYEGWDIDDAYDYLSDYFAVDQNYDDENNIVSELYYEVIGDPGAYMPYTLGHIFMNDMREKAEKELGSSFDAREYHEWLMNVGIAPFNVYDRELDKWLAAQK